MSEYHHDGQDRVDQRGTEPVESVEPVEEGQNPETTPAAASAESGGAEARAEDIDDELDVPAPGPATASPAPETGDLVIDAALRDLAEAPEDDLDAQVERGEQVQRTLQGRLSDLGG